MKKMSNKETMEKKHIQNITENDDSVTITFQNQNPEILSFNVPDMIDIPHDCDATGYIMQVLSASASDPDDGDYLVSNTWSDNGEVVCMTSTCNVAFAAGMHTVSYEACDQYGGCTEQSIEMMVNQINDAPLVSAVSDSYDVSEGDTVCLDGSGSGDECAISSFSWTLNGEEFSSEASFCADTRLIDSNNSESDIYSLTVTDVYGVTTSQSVEITINNINISPDVSLGEDLEVQVPHDHDPGTFTFSLDFEGIIAASDFDNDDLSYSWSVDVDGEFDSSDPDSISEEIFKGLAENNKITYLGELPHEEMKKCFGEASVFVLPSYGEGLPKVSLEAASTGLPIITTDVRGCRDCVKVEYNGVLVKPKDAQSLEDAMESFILVDPLKLSEYGKNSSELIKSKYELKLITNAYLKLQDY